VYFAASAQGVAKPVLRGPIKVTSAEMVRNFSELSDQALTEPVIITKNGRERLVLIAIEDYQRLKKRERIVRRIEDTPADIIALIEQAVASPAESHFDDELKDWKP
jgi:prevent-host-death family protein